MKIGFISDIHEDIIRLRQAIQLLEARGCDKLVCLGDIVGYSVPYYGYLKSRSAHDALEIVRKKCDLVLAGNHDLFAARKLPAYSADFKYPKNWYQLSYSKRVKRAKGKLYLYEHDDLSALLTENEKSYLASLPEYAVRNFDGLELFLSHYSYPDLIGTSTFEPSKPAHLRRHFEFANKLGCNISISGHDHVEGLKIISKNGLNTRKFGKVKLKDGDLWISGPCVANGKFANGVMVLDTQKMEITAIPLRSKKHTVPQWKNL